MSQDQRRSVKRLIAPVKRLLTADRAVPAARIGTETDPDTVLSEAAVDSDIAGRETDPRDFEATDVHLSAALPPDVALLRVTSTQFKGRRCVQLHFHHKGKVAVAASERELGTQYVRDIRVADLVTRAKDQNANGKADAWGEAYDQVRAAWSSMGTLVMWLRGFLADQDAPKLVVWDDTGDEMPWELFKFEGKVAGAERQGWLGELIPVVRWTSVLDGARMWTYDASPDSCEGGVLVSEDIEFDAGLGDASSALSPYEVEARTRSMHALYRRLMEDIPEVALVVARYHGHRGDDGRNSRLGKSSLDRLSDPMPGLARAGAIVLLNGCNTARPVGADGRSFAEVFLRRGARGVIATTGDISIDHSHDFAARLMEACVRDHVVIAEQLMRHRAEYARRVALANQEEDRAPYAAEFEGFFDAYTYVYFGHPYARLRICPPRGGTGDDE